MSRDAAEKVLGVIIRHSGEQDNVLADIQSLCSQDEFNWFRRMIGQSMGSMLLNVINPIVAKYPELKPPALD
jgi:hypothetical protein